MCARVCKVPTSASGWLRGSSSAFISSNRTRPSGTILLHLHLYAFKNIYNTTRKISCTLTRNTHVILIYTVCCSGVEYEFE